MSFVPLSFAEKSIDSIWLWYERASAALHARLNEERTSFVSAPVFLGMTAQEVESFFLELDFLTMLDLLSATEAAIRVDFLTRVQQKKKDVLSRAFRRLAKRFDQMIALEEHILEGWMREHPVCRREAGDFKGALKLRNWLAHGRYWRPRLAKKSYSAADIFDICDNLLRILALK